MDASDPNGVKTRSPTAQPWCANGESINLNPERVAQSSCRCGTLSAFGGFRGLDSQGGAAAPLTAGLRCSTASR